MLAFETGAAASGPDFPGLAVAPQPVATASAKFDLSLGLIEHRAADGTPAGIDGVLEYASDLFDEATVVSLGARLIRLLEGAVAEADQPLGMLPLLDEAERDTILRVWNDTATAAAPATFPELFAAQVQRTPDAPAIIDGDRTISYAEVDAMANRLAHRLRALGVGPETVVASCLERSPAMVVGLIGILKAGGVYLPLEPSYPSDRLGFMLADAGARVVLTRTPLLERLPETQGVKLVVLEAEQSELARQPDTAPDVILDPRHPAYVIYTSGSTGIPKGVVVEHASLASKVVTLGREFGAAPGFRIALLASSAFDPSIEQATLPLVHGASIVVIDDKTRELPHEFWEQLIAQKVDLLNCTPSFFESVVRDAPQATSLKHLALGGESFASELHRRITGT